MKTHTSVLLSADAVGVGMSFQESLRSLIRAISTHEKDIMSACDSNQYNLCFLASQISDVGTADDIQDDALIQDDAKPVITDENEETEKRSIPKKRKQNSKDFGEVSIVHDNNTERVDGVDKKSRKSKKNKNSI